VFDLVGYSERGMINALFYDMGAEPNDEERLARLSDFLGQCLFPSRDPPYPFRGIRLQSAKIRIEQSFSDFGDLDALLLLEEATDPPRKHAVFIEAKVKTSQRASWPIQVEWTRFLAFLSQEGSDSNLFLQLYRKVRLAFRLTHPDDEEPERCSIPGGWDLGTNPVVERAWMELTPYCGSTWYLAILPSSQQETADFFGNVFFRYDPIAAGVFLPRWSIENWGYLCWKELEEYCTVPERREHWQGLLRNFDYNRGQIYAEPLATPERMALTRERVETFLRRFTGRQRYLLRAIARAGGAMRQRDILRDLTFLAGDTCILRSLKSVMNKECDRAGIARILVTGPGEGDARLHEITLVDTLLRTWIIEIARDWNLEADPTAAI
jgi:hypothetical protein